MTHIRHIAALVCVLVYLPLHGQPSVSASTNAIRVPHFIDPATLNLTVLTAPPPLQDSETTREELQLLHQIEKERTREQVEAARADDTEEDVFIFRNVFGPSFTPANLPVLASMSVEIHGDAGVASIPLKAVFSRPRPYQADATLHPVCKTTQEPNSYPSGHALSGYLMAYLLIDIAPEKKAAILARADGYAHNRLVCGVHYPSDLVASRQVAAAMFGSMFGNPAFQKQISAARDEFRTHVTSATAK